ncbi:MAG TPA: PP2C family protein-serine/threonine phosphatase [Ignavibacteria bacterium]
MSSGNTNNSSEDPGLRKTIKKDLKEGDFYKTIHRDFKEIKEFYITPEKKKRLSEMKSIKRGFFLVWWILKSMILKLTPVRRILLLIGIVLSFGAVTFSNSDNDTNSRMEFNVIGGGLILLVLMLELKDKLLARDELEAGRKVQSALQPKESPEFEGWSLWLYTCPANEVCGDLVDFINIDKERGALVMADVAGKGLNAALLTAKLQATVRAYVEESEPIELVSKVNNIFFRDSLRNIFASLLLMEINRNSDELIFVNAGHLPPVILNDEGLKEIPKGETALGLVKDMKYTLHQQSMKSGDVLIAYSDGVTEARNDAGSFFGLEKFLNLLRTLKHLSAKEIGASIISEIDKFAGDTRANDDISLIIIKRT